MDELENVFENGEIDLTAIETAFAEFDVTVELIKQKQKSYHYEFCFFYLFVSYIMI